MTYSYLENGTENVQPSRSCEYCGAPVDHASRYADCPHTAHVLASALWLEMRRDPTDAILLLMHVFEPDISRADAAQALRQIRARIRMCITKQGVEFRLSHLERRYPELKYVLRHKGKARL